MKNAILLFVLFWANAVAETQTSRPNVLLIGIDDLNDWTGFLAGHPQARTPHMDALADRGRVFTNAHCAVPVCSASRVSVMSGMAAVSHGSYELGPAYEELSALKAIPTLHRYFKDHGYRTFTGGKVLHHGFRGRLSKDIDRILFNRRGGPRPKGRMGRPRHWSPAWDWGAFPETDAEMFDWQLAQKAAEALKESHDKPFFMSVGFFRPHVPLFVPPKWFELYPLETLNLAKVLTGDVDDLPPNFLSINQYAVAPTHEDVLRHERQRGLTQAYLASISFVDECVGIVMDALASSPYRDSTIIVLWSDHGFHLGEKHHWAKRTLWEESTRVPLLFAGPGIVPGDQCRESVSLIDIYPTLVEVCGLPEANHVDGQSLMPQLLNGQAPREQPAIISSYFGNHAVRTRDWRYIRYSDGAEELYNHQSDGDERDNRVHDPSLVNIRNAHRDWLPRMARAEVKAVSERDRFKSAENR